jgi:hypothetical protein
MPGWRSNRVQPNTRLLISGTPRATGPSREQAGAPARSGDRNSGVPPDAFNPRLIRAGSAPELLVHTSSEKECQSVSFREFGEFLD